MRKPDSTLIFSHAPSAPTLKTTTEKSQDQSLFASVLAMSPKNTHLLRVIGAFADALWPPLPHSAQRARASGNEWLARYYEKSGGSTEDILKEMLIVIEEKIPSNLGSQLIMMLSALDSRLGTLLFCGLSCLTHSFPFILKFEEMSLELREKTLQSWAASNFELLRRGYRGLKAIVGSCLLGIADEHNANPYWPGLGYPNPGSSKTKKPIPASLKAEQAVEDAIVDLSPFSFPQDAKKIQSALLSKGLRSHDSTSDHGDASRQIQMDCDVVVVGSGAGGGTVAAVLSEAGMRVLILEKSTFRPMRDMSLIEGDSFSNMYERSGYMTTKDGCVNILAGATVGGGTRINWCAALRTPPHVLKEWSEEMPGFDVDAYNQAMDTVCARLSVHENVIHNQQNKRLKEGLEKICYTVETMPRNCVSETCSGYCCFGCYSGEKQDGVNTYLADAARHGAKIIPQAYVKQILTEPTKGTIRYKAVSGVLAEVASSEGSAIEFQINAPVVVTACGSLHSPALLLRSGITCGGNVGKNLRLHPATATLARFPRGEDGRPSVRIWEDGMMSVYSKHLADWEGGGYGPLISVPPSHPGLVGAFAPFFSAEEFREIVGCYEDCICALIYSRDKDSGRVTIDAGGNPAVDYWPSKTDRENMLKGVEACVRGVRAAGADLCAVLNTRTRLIYSPAKAGDEDDLEEFVKHIHQLGIRKAEMTVFSAHQMGSCRMGASPNNSVVDTNGETWDVSSLYICDASVFPTCSGVNPMIATQSLAYMNALKIAQKHAADIRRHRDVQYDS